MKTSSPLTHPRALSFPKKFTWGVAAAAAQIEGAAFEGGKCPSIWDTMALLPGTIANGDTLQKACDHYHRYPADFKLMKSLGIRNYRFSFSWCRLFPEDSLTVNPKGVDFYRRLIECMLENGITPWGTMYHWDLPQYFQNRGGWPSRIMVDAFGRYADFLVKTFGDLVKNWFTLNEVRVFILYCYGPQAFHAPRLNIPPQSIHQALHHALLAHGHGVRAVREHGSKNSKVGVADAVDVVVPAWEDEECIHAAKELFQIRNASILGGMMGRTYDKYYEKLIPRKSERAQVQKGDFDLMHLPSDFTGLNIYTGTFACLDAKGKPVILDFPKSYPCADSPWLKLNPRAIYWGPRLTQECYGANAIYITENGFGYNEENESSSPLIDLHRKEYYRLYLEQIHRAIQDGVLIKGYFAWSFMDNFEWADGYARRFGLVHTNFRTQKRTPKLSARWYSKVIQKNTLI